MAKLEIRVGASIDRNMAVAFRPLVEASKKAKTAIEAESKKAAASVAKETKKGVDAAEEKFRELEREVMGGMPKAMNVGSAAVKAFGDEAKRSFNSSKREFSELAREAERAMSRISRAQREAQSKGMGSRLYNHFGGSEGVSAGLSRSGRILAGVGRAGAHAAFGLANSYAHGIGVNTSLASVFHKNAELEANAVALSNQSLIKVDPRNNKRVDPRELMREMLDVSKKTGTDANVTLEGLRKFVDVTGDLKTGREVLADLEMLAKATGTSMEDMVAAAGELNLALGQAPNKAETIRKVMNTVVAQGEMGGIPIRALAPQFAKVVSVAGQFEGDRANTITLLSALAQEGRTGGGAHNAATSANAIAGFANTFKTTARIKAFKEATGKDVFTKEGMIRSPEELIFDALRAKGMNPEAFKDIFKNVAGARAVEGLATIYRTSGGGAAGEEAVREALNKRKNAYLEESQVMDSFKATMNTSEAKANEFNNAIRETVMRLQDTLLPAFVALSPAVIGAAEKLSGIATMLFGNELEKTVEGANDKKKAAIAAAGPALSATEIGEGKILDTTEADMARTERELYATAAAAKSELNDAKKNRMGSFARGAATVFDYTPYGALLGMAGGGSYGDGLGQAMIDKESQDIEKKTFDAKNTERAYQEMAEANRMLHQKIDAGIVVRIAADSIEAMKMGGHHEGGGAGFTDDGRQPPPGKRGGH